MTDNSPHNPTITRERAALDELFDTLSKAPRRHILRALAESNPRREAEFVRGAVTSNERREGFLTSLHHVHLPKLDEAGFIGWNPRSKLITRGPRFDEIAPLVELLAAHRDDLPAGWP